MSGTGHEQVGGTGAEHMRDEEHRATIAAVVRSKVLEVARNGFAGATAGGEVLGQFCSKTFPRSPHLPLATSRAFNSSVTHTPFCVVSPVLARMI